MLCVRLFYARLSMSISPNAHGCLVLPVFVSVPLYIFYFLLMNVVCMYLVTSLFVVSGFFFFWASNCITKGQFTPWIMKSDHGRWSFSMVQLPWFDFCKCLFTKFLGPSLGVNRMWTKRNDHQKVHQKVNVLILFLIYV